MLQIFPDNAKLFRQRRNIYEYDLQLRRKNWKRQVNTNRKKKKEWNDAVNLQEDISIGGCGPTHRIQIIHLSQRGRGKVGRVEL